MKKLLALFVLFCLVLSLAACGGNPGGNQPASGGGSPAGSSDEEGWDWESLPKAESTGVTINVYNWGEYIDNEVVDVNRAFTHLTGIEVNYKNFESNESMYALLSSGAADYDVVIPSDYMIGKMIDEGMLAKLNFDNIPNYQYIDPLYKDLEYDPNNEYSVPYTWGVVGIFYNKEHVDEADLAQGWDLLWDEKYSGNIFMFDNPRDAFGVALSKLGYSLNTTDEAQLKEAADLLMQQKPLVQAYVMDQVYDKMINEDGWIAPYYSGDMSIMMGEDGNENIGFFIPDGKTNFFVDAMCVLANTKHQAEAEAYINFMCRTEVALANTEYIGYSTPHTEARKLLDPAMGENPLYYPPKEVLDRTEVFLTLPDATNELMNNYWLQLKQ